MFLEGSSPWKAYINYLTILVKFIYLFVIMMLKTKIDSTLYKELLQWRADFSTKPSIFQSLYDLEYQIY